MQASNSVRFALRLAVPLVLALASLVVAPGSTAHSIRSADQQQVVVAMVPDCEGITSAARAYAIAHAINVCGLNPPGSELAKPDNTVPGTCGTSTILLNKIGGGNTLSVNYGFYSTLGNMIFRSLVVSVGSTNGSSGGWPDVSPMNNFVYSTARLQTFPRHATALASLDGTATLAWGLVCLLKGPKASLYVS